MAGELAREWLKSALADLKSIDYIAHDPFLTHMVAFHAQQCVEKSLKALLERHERKVPKEHSTLRLFGLAKEMISWDVNMDSLSELDDLYIESRYPGDLGLMPHGKPSIEEARGLYDFALSFFGETRNALSIADTELKDRL